jgi:hypothetical protein
MAATARGQVVASALERLAIRFALLAAQREEVGGASHSSSSNEVNTHQGRSELDKLMELAEQAAANEPDPVKVLADSIRTVAGGNADPYLVMGVLIEGAVYLLDTRIPDERRADTAVALLRLVADRLRSTGILDGS